MDALDYIRNNAVDLIFLDIDMPEMSGIEPSFIFRTHFATIFPLAAMFKKPSPMLSINDLGEKICIIGPSSGGKSSLAKALGEKLKLNVCYLDQLAHIPNTNWEPKDKSLFLIEHSEFIENNHKWIIEGNYSFLMKNRFSKATTIIWLDFEPFGSLIRYVKRTAQDAEKRTGYLEGAPQKFNWNLVHYMFFRAPKNRMKYKDLINESNANLLHIHTFSQLKKYYKLWNLTHSNS